MWFVSFAHLKLRSFAAQDLTFQKPDEEAKKNSSELKPTKKYTKNFRDIIYIYFEAKLSSGTIQ